MPAMVMLHERDPREVHFEKAGDLTDVEVFNNQVLVIVYERPEQTASRIIITETVREEDKTQGKVGLIAKLGPNAFKDPSGQWGFDGLDMQVGDWIYFRASDGWAITFNKKLCRILDDTNVRGRIQHPDQAW
jgi:co-chaperonin GroES (HSP10)